MSTEEVRPALAEAEIGDIQETYKRQKHVMLTLKLSSHMCYVLSVYLLQTTYVDVLSKKR